MEYLTRLWERQPVQSPEHVFGSRIIDWHWAPPYNLQNAFTCIISALHNDLWEKSVGVIIFTLLTGNWSFPNLWFAQGHDTVNKDLGLKFGSPGSWHRSLLISPCYLTTWLGWTLCQLLGLPCQVESHYLYKINKKWNQLFSIFCLNFFIILFYNNIYKLYLNFWD